MKKAIIFIALAGLLLALTGGARAAAPVTLWEDEAGDADMEQGVGASIPAGFDLASGSIVRNGKNLEFTVTHHDMPPSGSFPEAFRFLWAFSVNGKSNFRLTVKSADIGKPDAAAGQTDERVGRADATGHFRLEGECAAEATGSLTMVNCPPLAYGEGTWDPATASFTMVVPLKAVKAKKGSTIGPGGGNNIGICSICWVSHAAERSLDATIVDMASMVTTYKIK